MSDPGFPSPSDDYATLLTTLKERIRAARLRPAGAVNHELMPLNWSISRDILARTSAEGWGAKVVQRLAQDLRRDFPDMTGLSPRNVTCMRAFAEAYPDQQLCNRLLHNCRGDISFAFSITVGAASGQRPSLPAGLAVPSLARLT